MGPLVGSAWPRDDERPVAGREGAVLTVHIHCTYIQGMGNTPNRTIRIDDEIWEPAAVAAKANGENLSVVIRRALIQYTKENQS